METEEMKMLFWFGSAALVLGSGGLGASIAFLCASAEAKRNKTRWDAERKGMEEELARLRRSVDHSAKTVSPKMDSAGSGRWEGATSPVSPLEVSYPEPEVADVPGGILRSLPIPEDLPPISHDLPEPAWTDRVFRRGRAVVVTMADASGADSTPIFVLGDLHGDADSLRRILAHVFSVSPDARIVFLGDLADRSPLRKTLECARLLFWAAKTHPGKILWLRGNHDSIAWNGERGLFVSETLPHDFADALNEHVRFREEGKALASFMATLPVAAVIGNVFLSHGGVLQDDERGLRSFVGLAALTGDQCSDLVWSRMRDVPSKLASRNSRGAEVGFRQAEAFAHRLRETDGLEIAHFVCGHQHEAKHGFGYLPFDRQFIRGVSCQCVTSFFNRNASDIPARPAILRLDGPRTPVPVLFPLSDDFS